MESSFFSDFWPQCQKALNSQLALQENILPFKSKKQAAIGDKNQLIKKNTTWDDSIFTVREQIDCNIPIASSSLGISEYTYIPRLTEDNRQD